MDVQFKRNREIHTFLYNSLEQTKTSIKAAVAWFTDPEIFKLLLHKKNMGIEIVIVLNNDEINRTLSHLGMLRESVRFSNIKGGCIMHHKFCIIDSKRVLTGSYNWTVRARRRNKENLLCLETPNIVEEYLNEFDSILKNSEPQAKALNLQPREDVQQVEDIFLLHLEENYNREIMERIEKIRATGAGVNIEILHNLIGNHTPVMAAKKLAESEEYIQEGLLKLLDKNRLDLSFEESIIRKEYSLLFDTITKRNAKIKLQNLGYFSNPVYQSYWGKYIDI